MDSQVRDRARALVVASFMYATYVAATCPCQVLAQCKQGQFYVATALPLVLVAYLNATETA